LSPANLRTIMFQFLGEPECDVDPDAIERLFDAMTGEHDDVWGASAGRPSRWRSGWMTRRPKQLLLGGEHQDPWVSGGRVG
jgi:hypothetical protein